MRVIAFSSAAVLLFFLALQSPAEEKGAKAIFYSGEGPTLMAGQSSSAEIESEQHSTGDQKDQDLPDDLQAGNTEAQKQANNQEGYPPLPGESEDQPLTNDPTYVEKEKTSPVKHISKTEKYMGIEYWISLVDNSGGMQRVTPSRTFSSGERIKLSMKANRNGYLYVMNIGSTGRSHILFPHGGVSSNFVKAWTPYEIPYNTYMRFDENPGQELLLVMLSPNPIGDMPSSAPLELSPQETQQVIQAAQAKGAKDIVLETDPAGVQPGSYAVAPISSLETGIITLQIKLIHN